LDLIRGRFRQNDRTRRRTCVERLRINPYIATNSGRGAGFGFMPFFAPPCLP
jgi:hypothetical protein